MLTLLDVLATAMTWWPWACLAWWITRFVARSRPVPDWLVLTLGTVVGELRPFYLPAVGVKAVLLLVVDGAPWWAAVAVFLMGVLCWWYYRDDDDDRWKRRRKKLAEKVSRVGSRLVVVPAGGGS